MLHITLTILKIIGMILLVLILLVIAVLFVLLFVPLRYRIQAVYTNDQVRGELRLTWLLHLISVRLALAEDTSSAEKDVTDTVGADTDAIDTDDADTEISSGSAGQPFSRFAHIQPYSEVRILGIRLESFLSLFGKIRSRKSTHGAGGNSAGRGAAGRRTQNKQTSGKPLPEQPTSEKQTSEKQTSEKQTSEKQKSEKQIPEKQIVRTQTQKRHTADNSMESLDDARENGKRQAESSDGAKNHDEELFKAKTVKEISEEAKAGEEAAGKSTAKDKAKNVNLLYKLSNICDKIRQMPSLLKRLCGQIKEMLSKPGRIKERVSRFVRKLEKYRASEVLSEVWSELKRLLHHYRVRDGSGYIRFGTGDPAMTGEITGVLYLVFPASCGEISIEPQFTQAMFETELQIRGHIRAVHMVRTAWWAFRNKKLRRLIRAFR